jgi:hypothetical protein
VEDREKDIGGRMEVEDLVKKEYAEEGEGEVV